MQIMMMSKKVQAHYHETDTMKVLGLPYKEDELNLYILMPKSDGRLYTFENSLVIDMIIKSLFIRYLYWNVSHPSSSHTLILIF